MWRVGLVALVACGRIGFDDLADAALDAVPDAPALATCTTRTVEPVPVTAMVAGTLAGNASEDAGSCAGDGEPEDLYQIDVTVAGSKLQIASDDPGQDATVALHVRLDCDDPSTEITCDLDSGIDERPLITMDVEPGRYFVFVDGRTGAAAGDYDALMRVLLPEGAPCEAGNLRDACGASLVCSAGTCLPAACGNVTTITGVEPIAFTTNTGGSTNLHASTCGTGNDGGTRAPERIFAIVLQAPVSDMVVSTDNAGTDYDTLLYLRSACAGPELACDDDGGAGSLTSLLRTGPLAAGAYVLFVDGFATNRGTADVTIDLVP